MQNLSRKILAFSRDVDRIEEIQKADPGFTYEKNDLLKSNIDLLEDTIKRLKLADINNNNKSNEEALDYFSSDYM